MRRADVLIVGGGLIGLAMAAALGGAGLAVVVVDREDPATATGAPFDGRVSAIAHGSRQVLAGIGVWPAMAGDAEPILDIRVSDGDSLLFLHYDHREIGDQPLGHIIENRASRVALLARLATLDNVTLVAPARVGRIAYPPGAAEAALSDGTMVRADLVVAADGRSSSVRRQAGIAVTRWNYAQTAIVCTMAHERPHRGIAHERFLPVGPFAVLPMTDHRAGAPRNPSDKIFSAGHRSSIVWTERKRSAPALLALDDAGFSAELGRRFGPHLGRVAVAGRRWSYPLALSHAETYIRPRLALIGDAAHVIHPIAGQGLNLGIRDVAALAEIIVDARRLGLDPGHGAVLEPYQRWRRFDTVVMMAMTDGMTRLFSNDFGPLRLARDLGLAAVDHLPGLKRLLMRHAMGQAGELPRLVRGAEL